MLSNYAKNLVYKKVYTGYYIERWLKKVGDIKVIDNDIIGIISKSLSILDKYDVSDGIEIGGFPISLSEISKLKSLDLSQVGMHRKQKTHKYSIGILAAKSNYYLWHGERSFGRNIHSDALVEAFKLFSQDDEFKVSVLGEETIESQPDVMSSLDAVYIPHQTAVSPRAINVLLKYNQSGLKLIQDMRFSTFKPDGSYLGDWQSKLFGISIIDWKNKKGVFSYGEDEFTLEKEPFLYAAYAILYPSTGYHILAYAKSSMGGGLMLEGKTTLALGFMPQLLKGRSGIKIKRIVLEEIKQLINDKLARNYVGKPVR